MEELGDMRRKGEDEGKMRGESVEKSRIYLTLNYPSGTTFLEEENDVLKPEKREWIRGITGDWC